MNTVEVRCSQGQESLRLRFHLPAQKEVGRVQAN